MIPTITWTLPYRSVEEGEKALEILKTFLEIGTSFCTEFILVACGPGTSEPKDLEKMMGRLKELVLKPKVHLRFFKVDSSCLSEGRNLGAWLGLGSCFGVLHPDFDSSTWETTSAKIYPLLRRGSKSNHLFLLDEKSFIMDRYNFWQKKLYSKTFLDSEDEKDEDDSLVISWDLIEGSDPIKPIEPKEIPLEPDREKTLHLIQPDKFTQWPFSHLWSKQWPKSLVLYCASFGLLTGRRTPKLPEVRQFKRLQSSKDSPYGQADCILFCDIPNQTRCPHHLKGWTPVYLHNLFKGTRCRDPVQYTSRLPKLAPFFSLWSYSASIYIDNNLEIHHPPPQVAHQMLGSKGAAWAVHPHDDRHCAYEEIQTCIKLGKDTPAALRRQERAYRQRKFPKNFGLWENCFIVRKHLPWVKTLCERWWTEQNSYSKRDQISFAYTLFVTKSKNRIRSVRPNLIHSKFSLRSYPHKLVTRRVGKYVDRGPQKGGSSSTGQKLMRFMRG